MIREITQHRYIVIEGPIGVGKSSLARKLAKSFGADSVMEKADENPFLERFYKDPKNAALPVQLFFLFQRAKQVQAIRQSDMFEPVRVSDFILDKDRLFARLNLDDDEYQLYEQIYQQLSIDAPIPDLVVYLEAPVDTLMQRVEKRGISYEQVIQRDYLDRLSKAYTNFFHSYDRSPLLIVNTQNINPIANEADYQLLLNKIKSTTHGRHFFNPLPIMQ